MTREVASLAENCMYQVNGPALHCVEAMILNTKVKEWYYEIHKTWELQRKFQSRL